MCSVVLMCENTIFLFIRVVKTYLHPFFSNSNIIQLCYFINLYTGHPPGKELFSYFPPQ